jgi:hypothetical protein
MDAEGPGGPDPDFELDESQIQSATSHVEKASEEEEEERPGDMSYVSGAGIGLNE